jgi:hypothetical protein
MVAERISRIDVVAEKNNRDCADRDHGQTDQIRQHKDNAQPNLFRLFARLTALCIVPGQPVKS